MRARGDPPVCPEQWPMVGHGPALLAATRKGRFGLTAVHLYRDGNRPQWVESRCGAVAVGRAYLLPPLSCGGASLGRPLLPFPHPPGRRRQSPASASHRS